MTKDVETGRLIRMCIIIIIIIRIDFSIVASAPKLSFSQHAGPVLCVQRSPFFSNILLTVGGWDFCIWKEGVQVRKKLKLLLLLLLLLYQLVWSPIEFKFVGRQTDGRSLESNESRSLLYYAM